MLAFKSVIQIKVISAHSMYIIMNREWVRFAVFYSFKLKCTNGRVLRSGLHPECAVKLFYVAVCNAEFFFQWSKVLW